MAKPLPEDLSNSWRRLVDGTYMPTDEEISTIIDEVRARREPARSYAINQKTSKSSRKGSQRVSQDLLDATKDLEL